MKDNIKKPMENLEQKNQEIVNTSNKQEVQKSNTEEKTIEIKKEQATKDPKKPELQKKEVQKVKKEKAVVNSRNVSISTKYSRDICRFIKNKSIEEAIKDLEQVLSHKKAIPMRGGYGHKKSAKGFASGSGKYPEKATESFIKLLKSLSANAAANGLEKPIITEAFANMGSKPRARFGKWQRKRTHICFVARELKIKGKKLKQ